MSSTVVFKKLTIFFLSNRCESNMNNSVALEKSSMLAVTFVLVVF